MLRQEDKDKLKSFGFDVDKLEAAVKSETGTEIVIPAGSFFTDETLSSRDSNKIAEGKVIGISEGKNAGFEIANKLLIEKFGLKEVKKSDEPNKIAEALQVQLGKGDEGLKGQIQELLKDKQTLSDTIAQTELKYKSLERNTSLLSKLPKNRSSILSDTEYLSLLNSNIEEIDGKIAIKLNGEILRDTQTQDLLSLDKGIEKVFESRKWIEEGNKGGRGGGDGNNTTVVSAKTWSGATEAYVKEHGADSIATPEYRSHMETLAKDPTFDVEK